MLIQVIMNDKERKKILSSYSWSYELMIIFHYLFHSLFPYDSTERADLLCDHFLIFGFFIIFIITYVSVKRNHYSSTLLYSLGMHRILGFTVCSLSLYLCMIPLYITYPNQRP